LGLDYEIVRSIRHDIVYASLSGFGQHGPYSRRGTVDALMQGFSGMMVMNRTPDGVPHRQNMTAVDVLSGLYLYSALTTALARRRRTGQGGYLDINLMQSAAAFQAAKIMEFHLARGAPKPLYMPAGYLRTKDGAVSLSTMRQAHYEALCNALGRSDLVTDLRFAEIGRRIENGLALMRELESETSCRDTSALLELLHGAGVFVERVQSYGDWLQDGHVRMTAAFEWVDDTHFGSIPVVAVPGDSGHPGRALRAPAIGEHTDEILDMLGLSAKA
jgi:crotonobetainyl-CoA:carnitine CoA-transferase CaiB-like acyl-CoA transferase